MLIIESQGDSKWWLASLAKTDFPFTLPHHFIHRLY